MENPQVTQFTGRGLLAPGCAMNPSSASVYCFVIISWSNCILESYMMSKYHGFHLRVFPLNSSTTNHGLISCNADLVCSGRLTEIWGSLNILYCYPAEQIKLSNWITSPKPLRCFSERWEWHCFGYAAQIQAQPLETWNILCSCTKTLVLTKQDEFKAVGWVISVPAILGTLEELRLHQRHCLITVKWGKLITFAFLSSGSVIMLLRATHGHMCPGLLTPVRPTAADRFRSVVWWSKSFLSWGSLWRHLS